MMMMQMILSFVNDADHNQTPGYLLIRITASSVVCCLPSVHSLSTFSVQLIVISEHFDNNSSTIIQPKSQSDVEGRTLQSSWTRLG